ncbi:MAG: YfiR family protein [Methylococcales bacterium]|nr:YfiR family protein [Methylococcales bacterium]
MRKQLVRPLPLLGRLLLALLLTCPFTSQAWAESANEDAIKTALLFNFFKFIECPEDVSQMAYTLCTTASGSLGDSLSVLEKKAVHGKPIVVRRGVNGGSLKNCNMVFISAVENAVKTIQDLKGLPVLTVSDIPQFIGQGGMIGLVQKNHRLGFEINLDVVKAVDIRISSQMLRLAKNITTQN